MGLFRFEGLTQRSVVIARAEGVHNMLLTAPTAGPAIAANSDARSMRSFTLPGIPNNYMAAPQDILGG